MIFLYCILLSFSFASGPKPPVIDPTIPNPYRAVVLTEVDTKTFPTPGGGTANFSANFQSILNTATSNSNGFIPSENWTSPCNTSLEIRSAVSSFQLNVIEAGISFGYTPIGGIGAGIPGLKGKFKVTVGDMSFDASVWQCVEKSCLSIAAATVNIDTIGTDLSFEVDFSGVDVGLSLATNPALGRITRELMTNAISLLAKNPRIVQLPWQASVKASNLEQLIFDAGTVFNIGMNQTFVIYEPTNNPARSNANGVCDVFKAVAWVHTTQVDTMSSIAKIDRLMNGGVIRPGYVVMVRTIRP